MKTKSYRFFFHYYRQYNCLTVHFKKTCTKVMEVDCRVPVETKWRFDKNGKPKQPHLVVQGFCQSVEFNGNKAIIQ
jgi:hypothetical protein